MVGARTKFMRDAIMTGAEHKTTRGAVMATATIENEPKSEGVAEGLRCYNALYEAFGCGIDHSEVDTHKDGTT